MTSRRAALLLALLSPVFTIGILIWMGSRPPHYFSDQGGLRIMFFYFPLTFAAWLFSALLSAFVGSRCPRQGPDAMPRDVRWCIRMLIIAGLCLSLLTLIGR